MCPGIPDSHQLQDGDIMSIDITVYLNPCDGSIDDLEELLIDLEECSKSKFLTIKKRVVALIIVPQLHDPLLLLVFPYPILFGDLKPKIKIPQLPHPLSWCHKGSNHDQESTSVDKASVLEDASNYIKEVQGRVLELKGSPGLRLAYDGSHPQTLLYLDIRQEVDLTKDLLSSRFSMKDMGEANVILVSTHMYTSEKLMPNNSQAVSQLEYSRVIGYLLYAMTYTRHDIAFAMGKLS
nr:zinc finger, CCHC-type [Tanacetum cinerariifolium]